MPFLYAIGALGTAVLILFIINYTDKLENCEKERHTKEMTKRWLFSLKKRRI